MYPINIFEMILFYVETYIRAFWLSTITSGSGCSAAALLVLKNIATEDELLTIPSMQSSLVG
jgi:hypothetical protein